MSGAEFERALAELFELLDYEVELIGGYDKGAEHCHHQRRRNGPESKPSVTRDQSGSRRVRQLIDGMKRYDCARGLVVTNSFFTEPAIECAEAWEIDLWDRRELAEYVDGTEPDVDTTICAECNATVTSGTTQRGALTTLHATAATCTAGSTSEGRPAERRKGHVRFLIAERLRTRDGPFTAAPRPTRNAVDARCVARAIEELDESLVAERGELANAEAPDRLSRHVAWLIADAINSLPEHERARGGAQIVDQVIQRTQRRGRKP